jgi:hypothetical protein
MPDLRKIFDQNDLKFERNMRAKFLKNMFTQKNPNNACNYFTI